MKRCPDCGRPYTERGYCETCVAAAYEAAADRAAVDHPAHYGGADNPYEAIKVIRAWGLGFTLGNAVKYIARAGKKDPAKHIEDLEKAVWYIREEIEHLKRDGG